MTTYAQVILKRELIISLAKLFGYTDEVKIYYDVPAEDDEKIKLRFVVKETPEKSGSSEPYYDRSSWFGAKLSAELGCEVDIVVSTYIPNLSRYDVNRKSALITDEKAIKEVIYRINNEVDGETPVDDIKINAVNLEDFECKNIAEKNQWMQNILIKQADEYLKKNAHQENPCVSELARNPHRLLANKKHGKDASTGNESQKKKLRSAVEPSTGQKPTPVNGNGTSSPKKSF